MNIIIFKLMGQMWRSLIVNTNSIISEFTLFVGNNREKYYLREDTNIKIIIENINYVKSLGYCSVLDKRSVIQILELAEEYDTVDYLNNLDEQKYLKLLNSTLFPKL